jgi:hypothetical protein
MANTIDWGKAAVNNTIDYGQGAIDNTINWGKSQTLSPSGETNITGTPSTPSFSNVNSFSFDGVDDYFLVPDTSGLSFGNGATDSPFSFSTWIKMTDATRFFLLSKGSVFSTNYEYLLNTNASDKIGLFLYDSSNNSRIGRIYNTALTSYENQWVHICSTYNGSGLSSGIKVYLNGVRVDDTDSNSGTYVAMESSNKMLNIGRTETGGYANGLTDETAIFNSELSASDVLAIYNNGEPQSLDAYSPLVWFRLGDNATWNGATWTMTSVGTDTRIARSIFMVEANRTTDVPT